MPIYFRSTPVKEPFIFDSIGNRWEQERVIRPNGFPMYHYLQTESGKGHIEIQGKKYELNEKEGVLIAPFISHSYAGDTTDWKTLFVTITGTIEGSIAGMLGNRSVIFTDREQGERIELFTTEVLERYEASPHDTKQFSIDCYRFLMNFVDGVSDDAQKNDPLYLRYVKPVVQEIETNYAGKLTAAQLARSVYVTPQYLSRLFGRYLGCSVYEYLISFRITKAKELLINAPRMEVGNIAHQVGFEDASHFIAVFKKQTGVTPLEFRNLHKYRK